MPSPSPLHSRTSALCSSGRWKDWAGRLAVCAYGPNHEAEYYALRHAATLMDVSPLFKYLIEGPDAAEYLSWVLARGVRSLKPGRVAYCCWTDDEGFLLDDGTVTRLGPTRFRLTAAEPSLHWLSLRARGFDVQVSDITDDLATLALQGPHAGAVLEGLLGEAGRGIGFFGQREARFEGGALDITRTGYTGDLGYELWISPSRAERLWDALMEVGAARYLLRPMGLDALDLARIEAGFIMAGVDYLSAAAVSSPRQRSTPYEAGLGWTVKLDRGPFVGQAALRAEAARGSSWATVGLVLDEEALARHYAELGLPVSLPTQVYRGPIPLYEGGQQVGYTTSSVWSPLLKQYLALATVPARLDQPGATLEAELNVEFWRKRVPAVVVERPFFNPARKRA